MKINGIEKIKLRNFKNFKKIDADFKSSLESDNPSLNFIYGGNASGKSNLVLVFDFLKSISQTLFVSPIELSRYKREMKYLEMHDFDLDYYASREKKIADLNSKRLINKYKRLSSEGQNMVVEVEIKYKESLYVYRLVCSDSSILEESLSIRENIRMTNVFSVENQDIYLSKQHFLNEKFRESLRFDLFQKLGKHTLMAILIDGKRKNSHHFMTNALSKNLINFMRVIENVAIIKNEDIANNSMEYRNFYNDLILPNLLSGEVYNNEINKVKFDNSLNFLTLFFKKYMPDIDHFEYKKDIVDNMIMYKLIFNRKNPEGKIIKIPYNIESFGNQAFTTLIMCFYYALKGSIIILDDIYLGLHDSILMNIMDDFAKLAKDIAELHPEFEIGQLTIIAQNTIFMTYSKRSNIFLLQNENGQSPIATITPASSYSREVQSSSNLRNLYISPKSNAKFKYESGDKNINLQEVDRILFKKKRY